MTANDLQRTRKRLGLTQVQFAERIGINSNSLARMERGELGMRKTTQLAIQMLVDSMERTRSKTRRER